MSLCCDFKNLFKNSVLLTCRAFTRDELTWHLDDYHCSVE